MRFIFSVVVTGMISLVVMITTSVEYIQNQDNFSAYTTEINDTGVQLVMVPIPGGVFTMNSSYITGDEQAPDGDMTGMEDSGDDMPEADNPDTDSQRQAVKVDPFWMGKYEITWEQYEAFADELPENLEEFTATVNGGAEIEGDAIALPTRPYVEMSFGMGKDGFPAISMTHYAAVMFTRWLTLKTGHFYRLPTEAEWEFACRGGSEDYRWFGDEWHAGNSDGSYNLVGIKEPNPYGLHDMLGNVAEWTMDQFHEDYLERIAGFSESAASGNDNEQGGVGAGGRVDTANGDVAVNPWFRPDELYPRAVRGGSWMDPAEELHCGKRRGSSPRWKQLDPQLPKSLWWHTSAPFVGIRVVRPLNPPSQEEMERYRIEPMEDY